MQSKNSDLKVGEKIYGYFPFAQFCILQPSGPITNLFFHVSRPQLSADRRVYNQYFRSKSDPDYSKDQEDYMCLFRPLWTTSFFLDDFLREYNLFKAERVIISSASSKTSYCLALILNNRGIKPIGLTSTGNVGFVESLGWYAQVFDYNEIHKMDNTVKLVYIDTAGSSRLNVLVHDHFKDNLVKHVGVGLSHYSQENVVDSKLEKIETSKFEMFFAPGWIKIRMPKAKEELLARKDKGKD